MHIATHGIVASSVGGGTPAFTNTLSTTFDGTDDYVKVGTSSLGITTAISISAWVKTASSGSNQYIIAEDPRSNGKRNWILQIRADGKFQCVIWSSNGSSLTSSITPLTYNNGQWHNVIATFDGTTNANGLKIYVDGTLASQATASVSGIFSFSSSEPTIGAEGSALNLTFLGNIDEVAVWNSDQSANASAIGGTIPTDLTSYSPLSWWRMGDGDTYPTITDNAGSNDGTMVNMSAANFVADVP